MIGTQLVSYQYPSAQDRSPFCIFHILNEIWLYPKKLHKFKVGIHYPILKEDNKIKRRHQKSKTGVPVAPK